MSHVLLTYVEEQLHPLGFSTTQKEGEATISLERSRKSFKFTCSCPNYPTIKSMGCPLHHEGPGGSWPVHRARQHALGQMLKPAGHYWRGRLGKDEIARLFALTNKKVIANFDFYARKWKFDIGGLADPIHIYSHPIYLLFIAAGRDIVPLLLRELTTTPLDWIWALEEITPDHRPQVTNVEEAVASWFEWGKTQGLC